MKALLLENLELDSWIWHKYKL